MLIHSPSFIDFCIMLYYGTIDSPLVYVCFILFADVFLNERNDDVLVTTFMAGSICLLVELWNKTRR